MARVEKNTVDYFPHLVSEGKKMFFIEQKYGNDGYVVWWKILEKLATTDFHFLNLQEEEEIMYLASKCRVSNEKLLDIINDLVKMNAFNKQLWLEAKIIWSQVFVDNIEDAYERRKNKCIDLLTLCTLLKSKCILKPDFVLHDVYINTQSRVEETKVEESREEKTKKEDIDVRKLKFASTLAPFKQMYGDEMIKDFYEYWTESNKSKTRFRQENQRNWDVSQRLKIWAKNEFRINKEKQGAQKPDKIEGALRAGQEAIDYFDNE